MIALVVASMALQFGRVPFCNERRAPRDAKKFDTRRRQGAPLSWQSLRVAMYRHTRGFIAIALLAGVASGCSEVVAPTLDAPLAAEDVTLDLGPADGGLDAAQDTARPDAVAARDAPVDARVDVSFDATATEAAVDVAASDTAADVAASDAFGDRCIMARPPPPPLDGGSSCIPGQTRCSGACVDLQRDRDNCGTCGRACPSGSPCVSGTCGCGCTPPGICCTDECTGTIMCADLASNDENCGVCFRRCGAGQRCTMGRCVTPLACAAVDEPLEPAGVCDGRGMIACTNWGAALLGGDGGTSHTVCVRSPAGCARANACVDSSDPSTCRCGDGPACGRGQVCVSTAGAAPACRCIRSAG